MVFEGRVLQVIGEAQVRKSAAIRKDRPGSTPSRLTKTHWIDAAREVLVRSGVNRIKVQLLAVSLETTTGSFYWHFKDRNALLDALLDDWEVRAMTPFTNALERAGADPFGQLEAIAKVWISADEFEPAYDSAMREWSRTSAAVERRLRRVDGQRIALLQQIFRGLGFDESRAFIRARIVYFHQIGYYSLRIKESVEQRTELMPLYNEVFTACAPIRKTAET